MTEAERNRINSLREQGRTYQEIAEETGLGLSAIKMLFKRQKAAVNDIVCCPQCKKALGKGASKNRIFCSDTCRSGWWRSHPERLSNPEGHKYTCLECGKVFFAYRATKFCSRECYYKSMRKGSRTND